MSPVHFHLALTHVPVILTPVGVIIFIIGHYRKNENLKDLSCILLIISTILAIPVFLTGEPAEHIIKKIDTFPKGIIHIHEETAESTLPMSIILGCLCLLRFIFKRKPTLINWITKLIILFGIATSILFLRTANLGGQIRHPEIRTNSPQESTTETGKAENKLNPQTDPQNSATSVSNSQDDEEKLDKPVTKEEEEKEESSKK